MNIDKTKYVSIHFGHQTISIGSKSSATAQYSFPVGYKHTKQKIVRIKKIKKIFSL